MDTGYYWCSEFGSMRSPQIMFVNCDDQDAGSHYALLIGQRERISETDPRFFNSEWTGPLPYPL
jgi:hypothetical protein